MKKNNHFLCASNFKIALFSLSLLCFAISKSYAENVAFYQSPVFNEADTFPTPPANKDMLFYLQRTPNPNTVIYALNYDSKGQINQDDPVHVYWIRYGEPGNPKKELNYIQRKFAYGVKVNRQKENQWTVRLVSYDKIPLSLRKGADGKFHMYVMINNELAIFKKAYIKIDGGTFWSPNVIYIELTGTNQATGKLISEKIYIK